MKIHFEKIITKPEHSFKAFEVDQFDAPYHNHHEIELTWIISGMGKRLIGGQYTSFVENDLVLMGEKLPHAWYSSKKRSRKHRERAIVIQFKKEFLGSAFFQIPELRNIRRMIKRAQWGIHFPTLNEELSAKFLKIPHLKGYKRIIQLIEILGTLSKSKSAKPISKSHSPIQTNNEHNEKINRIFNYVMANFKDEIKQPELAQKIYMSPTSFSRFFKKSTGMSFTEFVNKVRIEEASTLLLNKEESISNIAYHCGFSNLSNFNRTFLREMNITPLKYRKLQNN